MSGASFTAPSPLPKDRMDGGLTRSFDTCQSLLERFAREHSAEAVAIFAFEMKRQRDGDSYDPALLETYTRIWTRRQPAGDEDERTCCLDFVVEELINLRRYDGAVLIDYLKRGGCEHGQGSA
jgi:hypothetical protein